MTLFTDILKGLVESQAMFDVLGRNINFDAGDYVQITREQTIKEQGTTSKYLKYPLVWLVTPFTVRKKDSRHVVQNVKIVIAEETKMELTTLQREAQIFKPVLIPIYEKLLHLISISGSFSVGHQDSIDHDYTFFHYWGTQESGGNKANIFNDFVDVIEIKNLDLIIVQKTC